jgi:hypothetical protein
MPDRKQTVHLLISATYETDELIASQAFTKVIQKALFKTETLLNIITYQMPYPINPMQCGLKECWRDFTDEEREGFAEQYPDLATAISLMCGDDNDKEDGEGQPRIESDSTGVEHK